MTEPAIALAPQPDGTLLLYGCPGADAPASAEAIPASARHIAVIVDADGDTAPEPAAPLIVHVYRDGTVSVARGEG